MHLVSAILKWLIKLVLWSSTLSVILLCLAIARLVIAPVQLDFVRPNIQQQIDSRLPDWQIGYETARLGWNWRAVGPFLRVDGIQAKGYGDRFSGRIPSAEIIISNSILWGQVDVQSVQIGDTNLDVADVDQFLPSNTGNQSQQDAEPPAADAQDPVQSSFEARSLAPVAQLVARIADRVKIAFPKLASIEIASLDVLMRESKGNRLTRITLPRFGIYQNAGSIVIDAQADIDLGGRPMRLQIEAYALERKSKSNSIFEAYAQLDTVASAPHVQLNLSVSDIRLDDIHGRIELPKIVSAIQSPVQLALELEINAISGLEVARYDIDLGAGGLQHPDIYPILAPIKFGHITGSYDQAAHRFSLSEVTIDLGTTIVNARGEIFWEAGAKDPSGRIVAGLERAQVSDVVTYWPIARYPDGRPRSARDWIYRNMVRGDVSDVEFVLQWDKNGNGPFRQGSIYELTFNFANIDSYLIDTMPPVRRASGQAKLDESAFTMTIEQGRMENVEMRRSRMLLDGLDVKNGDTGYFHIHLAGDVEDILPVIDHRPVRLSRRLGPEFSRFRGQGEVWADIVLPLSGWVTADDVSYEIEAEFDNFEFDDFLDGPGIRKGDVLLHLDPDALSLTGTAEINGTAVDFVAREELALASRDADAETFTAQIKGAWQAPDLKAFKADITKWVYGAIEGGLTLRGRSFNPTHGTFDMKADNSLITIDELGWAKAPGVAATITGELEFPIGGVRLNNLHLTGEKMDATMNLAINGLSADSLELDAEIRQLGENSLVVAVQRVDQNPYEIDVNASRLDIRPFIGPIEDEDQKAAIEERDGALFVDEEKIIRSEDEALPRGSNVPDLILNAEVQSVLLLNGETLNDTEFTFSFEKGEPADGLLRGTMARTNQPIALDIRPGDDVRALELRTTDGGGILRGLGFFSHAELGAFRVDGTTYGWGDGLRMDIVSKLRDSRVYGLAEIQERLGSKVDAGGIAGIDEFIDAGGIELAKADVPMFYHGGLVDFTKVVANGPSIGITLEGQLHTKLNKMNINGVVVPAYGVNSLLGKIPIIGTLFSGGEGGGLFAVPYRIKGDMSEPDVDVSAGGAAVPGILRSLFMGRKGTIEDVEKEEAKKAAKQAEKEQKAARNAAKKKAKDGDAK